MTKTRDPNEYYNEGDRPMTDAEMDSVDEINDYYDNLRERTKTTHKALTERDDEIKRLTAERDDWAAVSEMKDSQIAWLQARVETLEGIIAAAPKPDMNEYDGQIWWTVRGSAYKNWYDTLAATEQGESDE